MGQSHKCSEYNQILLISKISDIIKDQRDKLKYNYLQHAFLPPASPVLANIYSILANDVPRTDDVGLPTKFRFNVGLASQPIAGSMPVNRPRC